MVLYFNHTETMIKYFITNLNNPKHRIGAGISLIDAASVERHKKKTALQLYIYCYSK